MTMHLDFIDTLTCPLMHGFHQSAAVTVLAHRNCVALSQLMLLQSFVKFYFMFRAMLTLLYYCNMVGVVLVRFKPDL